MVEFNIKKIGGHTTYCIDVKGKASESQIIPIFMIQTKLVLSSSADVLKLVARPIVCFAKSLQSVMFLHNMKQNPNQN